MRLLILLIFSWLILSGYTPLWGAPLSKKKPAAKHKVELKVPGSKYRGWNHLVNKLFKDGIRPEEVVAIYLNTRMPAFSAVPFSLAPREPKEIYQPFFETSRLEEGLTYLNDKRNLFDEAERTFNVSRYVMAAILLVETQFGQNSGSQLIIYRLSRLAAVGEPANLTYNYQRLKKQDKKVNFEQVRKRAIFLENLFYPEVQALFLMRRQQRIDLFKLLGSSAGAFGLPQFLPTSFLRYGIDANKDGVVSIFDDGDAIFSVANYLASHGWQEHAPAERKRDVIYRYNRSDAYVDAVLSIALRLKNSAAAAVGPFPAATPLTLPFLAQLSG
jgi:membrane-bound lytic murein transglycosylase B